MLKVQAIVREQRLEAVVERLLLIGIRGLTIIPVRGSGEKEYRAIFRGGSYPVHFTSKVLLEWFGPDDEADAVMRAIVHVAATGAVGDGSIFVEPLRIRTGERGQFAV
jgi:nitrogen regulatory protein PII